MATKILSRPLASMCLIGLIYIFCYVINTVLPLQIEGGLSWVFAFNIVPVQITIILIFIAEVAIAITKVTIVRVIYITSILLTLYVLVFRDDRTQVGLAYAYGAFYVVCAVTIYLTSIIFDRFLIKKYVDSFILNWVLVFFFALSACAFLGGRPAYEFQLYFVSFLGDYRFLVVMLAWSFLLCFLLRLFSRSSIGYAIIISLTALISLLFIHPIVKAVAFFVIISFTMMAEYLLFKNMRKVRVHPTN